MKVSLNLAQYYSNVDIKSAGVDEILRRIGAQLGAVEEVVHWGPRYDGIVVAKVVSCEKHPDADKLNVCMIDDGGLTKGVARDHNDNIQVVCGAPNAREGLTVAWLPPGVTVPSTVDKDPFVLEAREIRGVVSNGMLASPAELGISDNHDGILEIDVNEVGEELMKPGTPFKQLYGLDDVIIDCENKMFTHRPDCFGILGVARELAGIQGLKFQSPEWYKTQPQDYEVSPDDKFATTIQNNIPTLSQRFTVGVMKNVKVKPSPVWLQSCLQRLGYRPINNVVDTTNFIMHLTGQPLHAFDYDKVRSLSSHSVAVIGPRLARQGEKLALLNGKEIELTDSDIVIATNQKPIALAGVMGGSETEVDENTKNIIIECATFDMYAIRRTSMRHGLFTDAVTRFSKGQSPYQNKAVLLYAIAQMKEYAEADLAYPVLDTNRVVDNDSTKPKANVHVTADFINQRLGSDLKASDMKQLIENVEFEVNIVKDNIEVRAPFWRTDIEISEDVVEEVGRLHGFDKLPIALPKRYSSPAAVNETIRIKQAIREVLSAAGGNEVLTYTFIHGNLMDNVGQDKEQAYKLSNALSPDLQYYRMSLLPSLLDKVHANIKAGHNEFALFEINKVHCKGFVGEDKLPAEDHRLAFVFASDDKTAADKHSGSPYYQAQKYLVRLLDKLGIAPVFEAAVNHKPTLEISKAAFAPFEPSRCAIVKTRDGKFIGEIGEVRSVVRKKLKLPEYIAGFELDILQLEKLQSAVGYSPLSRFPSTDQDISLKVGVDVSYEKLVMNIREALVAAEKQHGYESGLQLVDIYQANESDTKNMTFRVTLTHHKRTLVTDEFNKLMDDVASAAGNLGAVRI